MHDTRGMTLLEMMVVVALITILVSVAVPSFQRWTASQRLTSSAVSIHSTLQLAKSEAIQRRAQVVLVFTPGTGDTGLWQAFDDADLDRTLDASEEVIAEGSLERGVSLTSAAFHLGGVSPPGETRTHFDSRGLATGRNGSVTLSDAYGKSMDVVLTGAGVSRVVSN